MKAWITADWHLGESRFELMGRPFKTDIEHAEALVANHNQLVAPDDEVIVAGDVCYQKTPEWLKHVSLFHGKKTLLRGNHDRVFTDEQLAPYFDKIIPEGEGIEITAGSLRCYVTHYPTEGVKGLFNLVGHVHAAWKYQLNMLNVGVDVHHFRPVDLNTISFHLNAIVQYYDRDVWVAYNELNDSYKESRGKAGTYFRPV